MVENAKLWIECTIFIYRWPAGGCRRKRGEGTLKIIDLRFRMDGQAVTRRRPPSGRNNVPLFSLFVRDVNTFECHRSRREASFRHAFAAARFCKEITRLFLCVRNIYIYVYVRHIFDRKAIRSAGVLIWKISILLSALVLTRHNLQRFDSISWGARACPSTYSVYRRVNTFP